MKEWLIDFDGYAIVPAEDKERAKGTFLKQIGFSSDSTILVAHHVVTNVSLYEPMTEQLSMFDEEGNLRYV